MTTAYNYKASGVDIEAGNQAVNRIKSAVESTFSPHVLTRLGSFGAMFDIQHLQSTYRHPVLVQSIDGVGTKMMVASRMQKFDTVGMDLVSATANDIIVLGAKPLTLLDYIANDQLHPDVIEEIVTGMAAACRENDIALIGGETAEMPGTYMPGEHDLVGVVTGVVEKEKAITGKNICVGDQVLALPSSGLHTNGYSLARKLLFELEGYTVDSHIPTLSVSIGEELLKPHLNYTRPILHLLQQGLDIKGMAHITGGGLLENIPRILPQAMSVEIQKQACPILPIFDLLQYIGRLNEEDLYRTFNMGMGLIMIVAPQTAARIQAEMKAFPEYPVYSVGQVVAGKKEVRLI